MNFKRVYLIAACGTGMSALAGLLKQKGCVVSGSDLANFSPVKDLLHNLQVPVHLGYEVEDLKTFQPDYVVIGNFVRRDNPQAQYVIDQKIPYGSMASTLEDFFLQDTQNIVVVGTHGKTTTSTALAHLLRESNQEPGYFIGGISKNMDRSFETGGGKYFIIEGDEYDTAFFDKESKFLHYRPQTAVWTSLEFDHADIFDSMDRIELMFKKFVRLLPSHGDLFYCADYPRIKDLVEELEMNNAKSYGFSSQADYPIKILKEDASGMSFQVDGDNYQVSQGGRYNAQNFSACVLVAKKIGLEVSKIQKSLRTFQGIKRRQEVRAEIGPHLVIDDFAHHPTAVRQTLEALKKKYPHQKLVASFEPRSNTSRRNIFQKEYEAAFEVADATFLPEVFKKEALGDKPPLEISSIVNHLIQNKREAAGPLELSALLEHCLSYAKKHPQGCVFALLSNGSFDGLHEKLISGLKNV